MPDEDLERPSLVPLWLTIAVIALDVLVIWALTTAHDRPSPNAAFEPRA